MRATYGFTLLEVLVALVVLAMSLSGASLVLRQVTRDQQDLYIRTLAAWVLDNALAEVRLGGLPAVEGVSSTQIDMLGWALLVTTETHRDANRRRWTAVCRVTDPAAPDQVLEQGDVEWSLPVTP